MSNVPAVPTNLPDMPEGLEDSDASDLTTPIIRIDHDRKMFVNNQTGEEFDQFECVLLGRKKQRILWPMDPGDGGEQPMCRSFDFNTGYPRPDTWVTPQKGNPNRTAVKLSGWTYDRVEAAGGENGTGLNCGSCPLKDWGADRTPPWCNEQWTFPLLMLDEAGMPQ
jgi:hypothetical protein